jgi:hypothetical protein
VVPPLVLGVREPEITPLTAGNWSARAICSAARACSMLSTATRRSRLLSSARAISGAARVAEVILPGQVGGRRVAGGLGHIGLQRRKLLGHRAAGRW